MKVLITCPRVGDSKELFDKFFTDKGHKVDYKFPDGQGFSSGEISHLYDEHELLIVGDDNIDTAFLENATQLKTIIKWGKGIDNIDKKYCDDNNINLYNSPGNISKYVAEHALALILSVLKKINLNFEGIKNNTWIKEENFSMYYKTVGFFGFGDISRNLSLLIKPFSPNIIFHDIKNVKNDFIKVDIEELFKQSDILIVAADLNSENEGMINFDLLSKMKTSSILINVSRGQLINQTDLIKALDKNLIFGAGLDVLDVEPIYGEDPLLVLDNVVITCHNASNTKEATISVNHEILELLKSIK